MGTYFKYGIYTIQNESEIPQNLKDDKYTFYVKINGKDIKDYYLDYMDIMQNAFLFHTKDCVGNPDAFRDWMRDLGWLIYDSEEPIEEGFYGYKNIILVFEHWNDVGKGFLSSGKKVREKILEDFMEDEGFFEEYEECFDVENDGLDVFNIYLIL